MRPTDLEEIIEYQKKEIDRLRLVISKAQYGISDCLLLDEDLADAWDELNTISMDLLKVLEE